MTTFNSVSQLEAVTSFVGPRQYNKHIQIKYFVIHTHPNIQYCSHTAMDSVYMSFNTLKLSIRQTMFGQYNVGSRLSADYKLERCGFVWLTFTRMV